MQVGGSATENNQRQDFLKHFHRLKTPLLGAMRGGGELHASIPVHKAIDMSFGPRRKWKAWKPTAQAKGIQSKVARSGPRPPLIAIRPYKKKQHKNNSYEEI
ncbi:hypothetical protein AKJ57_05390 [candidate division MSBL1 archaeon SCGC-AAA259A05]|uniref:Uncharacterized protein n=1 Tax=candidate division MSBL1 archaeon SCGC-AAA259A05 TaxID=1698259 RepID=A0A133U5C2_9EURY|nr:hypothetical protein AKJ57_05390 [candidate division MSBL1 archaeon SCGC-AAA259A05]